MSDFPKDYIDSRTRFRQAAGDLGARQHSFSLDIENAPDLSIDVALIGQPGRTVIVMTSGLHGVESQVGAAVQLAWMHARRQSSLKGRFVLIHALNPFGYAAGRRVNEDNVDLNRNFLAHLPDALASKDMIRREPGVSDYARFDALLNPACPPRRFDGFYLKALGYLAREGKQRLQGAIVTGQYEFPRGLFYGGAHLSRTAQLLQDQIGHWVGDAAEVCHLDFHTGLGRHAACQLLVDSLPGSPAHQWYERTFGASEVVSVAPDDSHAYQASGAMGSWLSKHFDDRAYRFLTAEFGTYSSLAVLGALREENQAYHYAAPHSAARARARRRLEQCFCPPSPRWRSKVLKKGLELVEQATRALT